MKLIIMYIALQRSLRALKKTTKYFSCLLVFRSLTSCLAEHYHGVVPSLFALCIVQWFTCLSTLARYDEPGLNMALIIFSLHCYQARPHSSVLR